MEDDSRVGSSSGDEEEVDVDVEVPGLLFVVVLVVVVVVVVVFGGPAMDISATLMTWATANSTSVVPVRAS